MRTRLLRSRVAQLAAIVAVVVLAWLQATDDDAGGTRTGSGESRNYTTAPGLIERAFEEQRSDLQVTGEGRIVRLLADDQDGARHQRFIVELDSGLTLLVAHNIDIAPRVADLSVGSSIRFHGEYEWNGQGGVLHWTHHDPDGTHEGGWLEYAGVRYD